MCWTGKLEDKHVAQEDIRVFKVCRPCCWLGPNYAAPYFMYLNTGLLYEKGRTYYSQFDIRYHWAKDKTVEINQGIHSYAIGNSQGSESVKEYSDYFEDSFSIIESCHSYGANSRIVLCTIPKGSVYYLNNEGCYVSECLRIDKIINSRVAYDNIREINNQIISFKILGH